MSINPYIDIKFDDGTFYIADVSSKQTPCHSSTEGKTPKDIAFERNLLEIMDVLK